MAQLKLPQSHQRLTRILQNIQNDSRVSSSHRVKRLMKVLIYLIATMLGGLQRWWGWNAGKNDISHYHESESSTYYQNKNLSSITKERKTICWVLISNTWQQNFPRKRKRSYVPAVSSICHAYAVVIHSPPPLLLPRRPSSVCFLSECESLLFLQLHISHKTTAMSPISSRGI